MAERPKAVVLKTTERKLRGFESLSLRQRRRLDRQGAGAGAADSERKRQEAMRALRTLMARTGGASSDGRGCRITERWPSG